MVFLSSFISAALFAAVVSSSPVGSGTWTPQLEACLKSTNVLYSTPNTTTWIYEAHGAHAPRVRSPYAVTYPTSTKQVAEIVNCAVSHNVRPNPRGGGHNYEQFSAENNQIIINLSAMNDITVFPEQKIAVVGGGTRLGPLYIETSQYNLSFSGGVCGSVGLGGHIGGGGLGVSSRTHGFAADNVLAFTLVDWKGNVYYANSTHHSDLYWAVRGGGGGNFGVVTEFTLNLFDGSKVTSVNVNWGYGTYTVNDLRGAMKSIMAFKPWNMDPNFSIQFNVGTGYFNLNGLYFGEDGVTGAYKILNETGVLNFGNPADISFNIFEDNILWARAHTNNHSDTAALDDFIKAPWDLAPFDTSFTGFVNIPNYNAFPLGNPLTKITVDGLQSNGIPGTGTIEGRGFQKYAGQEFDKPWDDQAIEFVLEYLNGTFSNNNGGSLLQLEFYYGGNAGLVSSDFNAYPWRENLFHVQYLNFEPFNVYANASAIIRNLQLQLAPYANGYYVNYPSLEIGTEPSQYIPGYFGSHAERLTEIKTKYDPLGYFWYEQALIPESGASIATDAPDVSFA